MMCLFLLIFDSTAHLRNFNPTATFRDKDLKDIFEQNVAWKSAHEEQDPEFFDKLGAVHKPNYMWIGEYQLSYHLYPDLPL